MYRVIDITKFLFKSRIKEFGIMFGILFGVFLLMAPAIGLVIFAVMLKIMGLFLALALVFTSSLSGLFNDYKILMYKGVTRDTFAKSYIISSLLIALAFTIYTIGVKMFPLPDFGIDLEMSLLGVDLKLISLAHSIVLHTMILLAWSGVNSLLSIIMFKKLANKAGINFWFIVIITTTMMNVLLRLNINMDWLFVFTKTIGYSIPLTVLFYGVLSVVLYYVTYKRIKKLEV